MDVDTPEARSKHGANTRSGGRGARRGPRACPVSEWPAGHSGAGACLLSSVSHGPFRPHKEPLQLEPWSQVSVCAPGSVRVLSPESASLCGRLPLSRGSLPSLAAQAPPGARVWGRPPDLVGGAPCIGERSAAEGFGAAGCGPRPHLEGRASLWL